LRYGYARVSSKGQDYAAQVEALKAAGCERIFSEKVSARSTTGRSEFEKLKRALLPGDAIVVTKLDRLARSSRDLHNILYDLNERQCGFVSLGEAWCDTTTDVGRLMMTIMGGIAEFERGLIRKRCEEGIERAKHNGTKFGRPTTSIPVSADASQSAMPRARRWPSLPASTSAARPRFGVPYSRMGAGSKFAAAHWPTDPLGMM
jgi:DNA invertase Pin-like site-specific DNA recombinase